MNPPKNHNLLIVRLITVLFLISFFGSAQTMQVEIVGGAVVTQGSTITINAGTSLDFRITNVDFSNCKKLKIKDVNISNTADFDISPNNPKKNIKPEGCRGGKKKLDFEIENMSTSCTTASTLVTIKIKNQADFTFTLEVNVSPIISVTGGSPSADILDGVTVTTATNGTYFGVVETGDMITRNFVIINTGSCPLTISAITSDLPAEFIVGTNVFLPDYTPTTLPYDIDSGSFIIFTVTFIAPVTAGERIATISISNNDNTNFTFNVSGEVFNFNIPGPGGITAEFRLWLKSSRGITETSSKVSNWADIGTNGKDASQSNSLYQPTYLDNATDNINFNPVIKFENDGASVEQYLENTTNGFYSQDIFIVMIPDATMTSASTRNTIFAGTSTGNANDITGVGFGDYSTEFTSEVLSYNQDVAGSANYNGEAEISTSYSNAGIINVRNDAAVSPTGQDILYNSTVLTSLTVNDIAFANVGTPGPPILGTQYWIGRNFDVQGSLNGRIAEIFTFAERVTDAERQKIESYLAIKYGITLGAATEAQKDYINSFDTKVWDIIANTGFNYHVTGIGRDSISDLNHKQSKTLNLANEVTISLGGVFTTNSANTNEFKKDGDFLVWGTDNGAYTGVNSNTLTIATGITTTLTRIDRKWKIIESTEDVNGDVETVYLSIPSAAFSSFTLAADEEYALIVADNASFANGDIIDVLPLKSDGAGNLQTWYDFDGTLYFTFGKTSKLTGNRSVSIASGDYLVGESAMNLNPNAFTVSAWVKSTSTASTRTIMAKGSKLQMRLNASDQVEVTLDDLVTAKFTSTMTIGDGKWHQISFVYKSGTIFLYIDGVLDKSVQDVVPPSPNFNHFSVGAIYDEKNTITNPFLGEIDEIYIWNQALTEDQVRYLMNQEIERFDISGTDYVTGKTIPQASASNEVATIPWSYLQAYYDFNSFYGSTIEGLTDDRNFLRLKYLAKDKTVADTQTIAVPYVSAADGEWSIANTWSNNADQVPPNSLSLDGVTMIDWNIVQTSHNITSGNKDVSVLGLVQTAGKITIADPGDPQDETNLGQGLTVSHYLEIDGVLDLVGESQLVQSEGSIIDADSGGYIERDQQGTANSFNYNYWSSSVGPISGNTGTRGTGVSNTNANHSISGVLNDGTTSSAYQNITFNPSYTAADNAPTNPRTISTYWLYTFYGAEDDYNAWTSINENSSLLPGEGYTMKGTSGSTSITNNQNYVFKGMPNNGNITLPLNKNITAQNPSGNVDRLIGNPYPSAIDATEFILDNLSIADGGNNVNGTIFNGALYFWDHFGEENSHNIGEYVGGYATRNLTAGAVAISNDSRVNNTSNAGGPAVGTKAPGQYIPVNQGFFVTTALDGFNNDDGTPILTVDGGDIVFQNSQRVFVPEDGVESLFMRVNDNKKNNKTSANNSNDINNDNPVIRLMYNSPKGYHRQIVIGIDKEASNGFDLGYDAFMADINEEDMYWIFDASKFVIQGVNTIDAAQEFALGLKVKQAGLISIKIDALEKIDPTLNLYIKDNTTGETYRINNIPFEISLDAGTYEDRFKLVFQSNNTNVSSEDKVVLKDGFTIYYDSRVSEIKIIKPADSEILGVNLYNVIGQRIESLKYSSGIIPISTSVNSGVYIVKLNTTRGIISKRIIIE
jgi:Concanavalin A-like lectin/glucanases superfamily